ncbi:MAG: hypothetical protein ABSF48_27335 [Thermodesulfobacteriota bacterium]
MEDVLLDRKGLRLCPLYAGTRLLAEAMRQAKEGGEKNEKIIIHGLSFIFECEPKWVSSFG